MCAGRLKYLKLPCPAPVIKAIFPSNRPFRPAIIIVSSEDELRDWWKYDVRHSLRQLLD